MKTRYALLRLAIALFGLAAVHALTPTNNINLCPPFAVLCSTGTSAGHCGFQAGENCRTCYGDNGSMVPFSSFCDHGLAK
jgi:hypothetical protein